MTDTSSLSPAPHSAIAHVAGNLLLMAENAAIYSLESEDATTITTALEFDDETVQEALSSLGLETPAFSQPPVTALSPVKALALTVSQTCNLACSYCYASGGNFGGADTRMSWQVARKAVDRLLNDTIPGGAVKIAFMGGEPMVARELIEQVVAYTKKRAATRAISTGFSITTNGTLITLKDAAFFAEHKFAVTVSLDGGRAVNDLLRPTRSGKGSFDRVAQSLQPLFDLKDRMSLSARVTVTPANLDLPSVIADIAALGFSSVGVSPMITSPTGKGALSGDQFDALLATMIDCGDEWMDATLAGRQHAFANLATVLGELHRGKPRSHGCGAVRDYLAVDASGEYSACHRFVKDPAGRMGNIENGIDHVARIDFLSARTVERQNPCTGCWARRLCGGGCHQEVLSAGRPACDFVRGWLSYGLQSYGHLLEKQPQWFKDQ